MKDKTTESKSLIEHLQVIPDPRMENKCAHPLVNIMAIAICAIIAGADDWNTIELFGKNKRAWFERFLDLKSGIPSFFFDSVAQHIPRFFCVLGERYSWSGERSYCHRWKDRKKISWPWKESHPHGQCMVRGKQAGIGTGANG
jgi:DDE_Tnp_1-associated